MRTIRLTLWALVLLLALAAASCSGGGAGQPDPGAGSDPAAYKETDVVKWNYEMVTAIRPTGAGPTDGSRTFYMIQTAIYDAWAAYTPQATPVALDPKLRRPTDEQTDANRREAVNYAAYFAIKRAFPNYDSATGRLTALLTANGFDPREGADPITPAGIGRLAVEQMWASRENDGSNAENGYKDTTSAMYPQLYQAHNSDDPLLSNCPGGADFDLNAWVPLRCPNGTMEDSSGWAIVDDNVPSSYFTQNYLTPHWGAVKPFALSRGDQLRPEGPPKFGDSTPYTNWAGETRTNDEEYRRQVDEVLNYSGSLTDREKIIARYWAREFKGSMTPPGHLNMLAYGISERDHHTLDQDVKMYFAINAALFDSGIAAWECKRYYANIRPISAIKHMYHDQVITAWNGAGRDAEQVLGQNWRPFMPETNNTPPFPDYVSGHATFTAAWAQVLTSFTGSSTFYDGVTRTREHIDFVNETASFEGPVNGDKLGEFDCPAGSSDIEPGISPVQPVTLRWNSFFDCAEESGISRLYMGIHFMEANKDGQALGVKVANSAMARCEQYWGGQIQR